MANNEVDVDVLRATLTKKLYDPTTSKQQIKAAMEVLNNVTVGAPAAEEGFSSIREVCRFIGISRVSVWRLCAQQKLTAYTIGRRKLFRLSEVAASIKGGHSA